MSGKNTVPAFPAPTRSQEELIAVSAELLHKELLAAREALGIAEGRILGLEAVVQEQQATIQILLEGLDIEGTGE